MQTLVVKVVASWTSRIQSWSGSCSSSVRLPKPPGTTTMSGLVTSSREASATRESVSDSFGRDPAARRRRPIRSPGTGI